MLNFGHGRGARRIAANARKNLFSLRIICCSLCRLMQRITP
jgi:hypothetical protein